MKSNNMSKRVNTKASQSSIKCMLQQNRYSILVLLSKVEEMILYDDEYYSLFYLINNLNMIIPWHLAQFLVSVSLLKKKSTFIIEFMPLNT